MSRKQWLLSALVLVLSNVATFKLSPYIAHAIDYIRLQNDIETIQIETEENDKIYVIVAIPDDLVVGDESLDYAVVQTILFSKDEEYFKYRCIEKKFGHHAYVFHPIKRIAVAQRD